MGWKGNIRTGLAIARRIERAEKRRASESARQYRAMAKEADLQSANSALQKYNDYLAIITSTHKETSEFLDWHEILSEKKPIEPRFETLNEQVAKSHLENYKPSFFSKALGISNSKIKKLQQQIQIAQNIDKENYAKNVKDFNIAYANWRAHQRFAQGALSKDPEIFKEILEYLDPFSDIKTLGTGLNINFTPNITTVSLFANEISVIPDFTLSQTSTGKVTKKKMPQGKFNELYQDYICSCALRVAREIFSFLPVELCIVNVKSDLLNSATGHLENQSILSVGIPRNPLERINFESIDPSDSMKNFKHNMKFSKLNGFNAVCDITSSDVKVE